MSPSSSSDITTGRTQISRKWHRQCHQCAPTGYRFSIITGTIFENTNKPLRDWYRVIHLMLTSKKGMRFSRAYDACHKVATRVSSLSLVRYRNNDYSVPTRYGHQEVLAKGYVDRVEIACRGERSPPMPAATTGPSLSTIRCITSPCWNTRARRSIKRRPWMIGGLRTVFIGCGGSWKPGWGPWGGASSSRCCG
jgi:hypothetical protein